jgi:hypothetical protein
MYLIYLKFLLACVRHNFPDKNEIINFSSETTPIQEDNDALLTAFNLSRFQQSDRFLMMHLRILYLKKASMIMRDYGFTTVVQVAPHATTSHSQTYSMLVNTFIVSKACNTPIRPWTGPSTPLSAQVLQPSDALGFG